MNNIRFHLATELGSDLSSRQGAAAFREQLLHVLDAEPGPCVLSLADVRCVSHSFADELFAVLVEDHGEEWFKAHLQLRDVSPIVRQTILEAIQQRQHLCH